MTLVRAVLVVVLVAALAGCNSDDGASAAGAQPAFRNLGKRADSNLAGQRVGAPVR
jgi:hypothetical protein